MTPIRTHNAYHLGDNLVHLNFLRRAALRNPDREFVHACAWQYLWQMKELITDVPNLKLCEFGYLEPTYSIDAWRGSNGFWYHHKDRNDFVKFHVESWFPYLAKRMGIVNPVGIAEEMLFVSPQIRDASLPEELRKEFDVLIINSPPQSGQFYGYDKDSINGLAWIFLNAGKKIICTFPIPGLYDDANGRMLEVPCTQTYNLSVTAIGHLSLHCKCIVMISTGPSWTTFNPWNRDTVKLRVILLDSERVNISPNTVHCSNVPAAAVALQKAGMI